MDIFKDPSMVEIDNFLNSVNIKIPSTKNDFENIANTFDCCLHLRGGDFLLPENASLNICDLIIILLLFNLLFLDFRNFSYFCK